LGEALFGETVSGIPVDPGAKLLDSGVSLIEDWAKMELVYTGAEALSSSAGVLARQGVELTTLNLISDFTGVPVVTRGGLELTRHTATESLAGRYALRGGRRAATMDELDALYRSGVPKPNVPRGTMEITRPDLPKVKMVVAPSTPTPYTRPRVITVIVPRGTPPIE
jgi:hypothetical protein